MDEEAKKLIPLVYKDLAQPGVRRLGQSLAGVVNTALRPAEGALWPVAFALKELTAAEEARIGALVKKAVISNVASS